MTARKKEFSLVAALIVLAGATFWMVRSRHHPNLDSGVTLLESSRVYDVVPVAHREQGSEITLDGEWDLAEARQELRSDKLDLAGLTWKRVRVPNSIQYVVERSPLDL